MASKHGVFPVVVLPHVDRNEVLAVRKEQDEEISQAAVNQDGNPRHLDHAHHHHRKEKLTQE